MSLILFLFCAASFYGGFKCGHRFANIKALGDGIIARIKSWAGRA